MYAIFAVILRQLDDQYPLSGKDFSCCSVKRPQLVILFYKWRCIKTFNRFCKCEPGTVVDLAILASMVSQDFSGSYPVVPGVSGVPGVRSGDDKILIKVTWNQQKARGVMTVI